MTRATRTCAHCGAPIPENTPRASYCRPACRQASYKVRQASYKAHRTEVLHRGTVWLDDVAWLLSFGVRVSEIASRMDVKPEAIHRAVQRQYAAELAAGCVTADTARLYRLHADDRARSRAEAAAERYRSTKRGRVAA